MSAVIKAIIVKIAVVVFSITITLLLMELSIRLFWPQPLNYYNFTLILSQGAGEMMLGSNIVTSGEKANGFGPYIPKLSTNFGGVKVTINSRGWRDVEYALEKSPDIKRVMVVGDSVVFGYGVELDKTFPRLLERGLNSHLPGGYQVISLGGAGANTYSQRRIIKNNTPIYKPDLVILAFNLNDILPNIFGKKNARSGANHLFSRAAVRVRRKLDREFGGRSHLYFLVRERMKVMLRKFGIAAPTLIPVPAFDLESKSGLIAWSDTQKAILEIAEQLRQDRVAFLLAILPVDMQLSPEIAALYREKYGFVFDENLVNGGPQKTIAEFARQHGIAYVDLLSSFQKNPEQQKFFRVYGASIDWNHPNQSGHETIATEIEKELRSMPLISDPVGKAMAAAACSRCAKIIASEVRRFADNGRSSKTLLKPSCAT